MNAVIFLSAFSILLLRTHALSSTVLKFKDVGDDLGTPKFVENEWRHFKLLFRKTYKTTEEEQYRRLIWESNHWRIQHHNLLASSGGSRNFSLGVNQFADMLPEEFAEKYLTKNSKPRSLSDEHAKAEDQRDPPPAQVDWRTKGCVSPVIDQGQLGYAAIFGVVGSVEGQVCSQFGPQRDWLSYQQVVDCANATNSPEDVYAYLASNQGMLDWLRPCRGYRSRSRSNNPCSFDPKCVGAIVKGSIDVVSASEAALQAAVAAGPVTVEVDASHTSFQLYKSGVYNEPDCSSSSLDHVMLVVGYGVTDTGEAYWVVKNSWGASWGQKGYILMSRNRGNQCGIATAASYALAKPAQL